MLKCLKFSVKYLQLVMVWGVMLVVGVGLLCFIKGRVNVVSYQEILEYFMFLFVEKFYGDEDFVFQYDLVFVYSVKIIGKWFIDYGIIVFNWFVNFFDLNFIENLWDIVKRKLRDVRFNILDEFKVVIEVFWVFIIFQQCYRLIVFMLRRIEVVIFVKGFSIKY